MAYGLVSHPGGVMASADVEGAGLDQWAALSGVSLLLSLGLLGLMQFRLMVKAGRAQASAALG
jgi:hypothetical protein